MDETFTKAFEGFNANRETLVCICACTVDYSGRAESHLPEGDRVLIFKADGTLLVHQPENSEPINYMKEGTSFTLDEDEMIVEARDMNRKEYMTITLHEIYDCTAQELRDGQSLELAGTEEDMSDMIRDNPGIISDEFTPLSREEHTKFGFIDVFGHDGSGNLVLVECKRYTAGLDAVQQLRRYVEKIEEVKGVEPDGIIASPEITDNAEDMLQQWGFSWTRVEPPKRLERYHKDQESLGEYT